MSYDFGENTLCCQQQGHAVIWNPNFQEYECVTEDDIMFLDEACEALGVEPDASNQWWADQDPVTAAAGWTFDNVNTAISGVGGIVNNLLGIFGLGTPKPTDYSDPNALDQAQDRQQMNLILGFVAVIGLIMAGVYYSRKK